VKLEKREKFCSCFSRSSCWLLKEMQC